MWICLGFIVCRGNVWRTYHYTFTLELIILGLWIPPVYYIAADLATSPDDPVPKSTQATLAMFALNMLVGHPSVCLTTLYWGLYISR